MSKSIIGATLAIGLAFTASTALAVPVVTISSSGPAAPVGTNTFQNELNAAGAGTFLAPASFILTETARLTFTAVAAESGFDNTFTLNSPLSGSITETGNFGFGANFNTTAGIGSLSGIVGAGSLNDLFQFTTNSNAVIGKPLSDFVGVYSATGPGSFSRFFLAFDDDGAGPDDNHDDFIMRVDVTAVPLPAAAWLLLVSLAGLGFVGRRRPMAV